MGTFGCKDFLHHIEPWMEGERHPDARAHVRDCPKCRGIVEDLAALQTAANDLSRAETEPPAHLWTSLRAQLEQEGLIRSSRRSWARWLGGSFAGVPRPALAGAYLALLIAVAFGLSGPIHRQVNDYRWSEGTRTSTAPLGAQLDTAEHATVSSVRNSNPTVTASLHSGLAIVDNYIALCEKSVREEPQNELARDYLYEAYQQKADLLEQMTERGEDVR
ncbi:MAG: hypothetical protein WBP79_17095 [Candidatus Acidiferrales bacterium]